MTTDICNICKIQPGDPDAIEAGRLDYPNARDCEHGSMRRKCEICQRDGDIAELRAELAGAEAESDLQRERAKSAERTLKTVTQDRDRLIARLATEAVAADESAIAWRNAIMDATGVDCGPATPDSAEESLRVAWSRLASERDASRAEVVDLLARWDDDQRYSWWATYRAALTGLLAFGIGTQWPADKTRLAAIEHADAAHGKRAAGSEGT